MKNIDQSELESFFHQNWGDPRGSIFFDLYGGAIRNIVNIPSTKLNNRNRKVRSAQGERKATGDNTDATGKPPIDTVKTVYKNNHLLYEGDSVWLEAWNNMGDTTRHKKQKSIFAN
jgi:hypothetical protein